MAANSPSLRGVLPYLHYKDPAKVAAWLERVLGFRELSRWIEQDGVVSNVEIAAGDTEIWLAADAGDQIPHAGHPAWIGVWVDDVDAMHARLTAAGVDVPAPQDQFYGVRSCSVSDPEGRSWGLVQRIPVRGREGVRYVEREPTG